MQMSLSTVLLPSGIFEAIITKINQHTTTVLLPFFWNQPGEPVPENFWTLWCKGRLTEADTPTN